MHALAHDHRPRDDRLTGGHRRRARITRRGRDVHPVGRLGVGALALDAMPAAEEPVMVMGRVGGGVAGGAGAHRPGRRRRPWPAASRHGPVACPAERHRLGDCCNVITGAPPADGATAAGAGAYGCPSWGAAEAVDAAGTAIARPQKPRTNRDRTRMRELLSPVRDRPGGHPLPARAGILRTKVVNGGSASGHPRTWPGREEGVRTPRADASRPSAVRPRRTKAREHAAGNPAF